LKNLIYYIFISYSRRDLATAQRIVDALVVQGGTLDI